MKRKIVSELKKGLGFQHSSGVVAAQEQARIFIKCSQVNNVNLQELREALNTKWNVDILKPRDGIGGDCLPKDTKMFLQSSQSSGKSKVLTAALKVDRDYRRYRKIRGTAIEQTAPEQLINPDLRGEVLQSEIRHAI